MREGLWFCCERKWGKVCDFVTITCCNAHCAASKLANNNLLIQRAKEVFFKVRHFFVFPYNIITDNTILCLLMSITTFIVMYVPCVFYCFYYNLQYTIMYHNNISLYNSYCYMFRHFHVIISQFYVCFLVIYINC